MFRTLPDPPFTAPSQSTPTSSSLPFSLKLDSNCYFAVLANLPNNHLSREQFNVFLQSRKPNQRPSRATSNMQMQEGKQGGEDERVVVRSRPARNLASMTLNRFPTEPSSSSSQGTSNLRAKFPTLGFIEYGETCLDGFE